MDRYKSHHRNALNQLPESSSVSMTRSKQTARESEKQSSQNRRKEEGVVYANVLVNDPRPLPDIANHISKEGPSTSGLCQSYIVYHGENKSHLPCNLSESWDSSKLSNNGARLCKDTLIASSPVAQQSSSHGLGSKRQPRTQLQEDAPGPIVHCPEGPARAGASDHQITVVRPILHDVVHDQVDVVSEENVLCVTPLPGSVADSDSGQDSACGVAALIESPGSSHSTIVSPSIVNLKQSSHTCPSDMECDAEASHRSALYSSHLVRRESSKSCSNNLYSHSISQQDPIKHELRNGILKNRLNSPRDTWSTSSSSNSSPRLGGNPKEMHQIVPCNTGRNNGPVRAKTIESPMNTLRSQIRKKKPLHNRLSLLKQSTNDVNSPAPLYEQKSTYF